MSIIKRKCGLLSPADGRVVPLESLPDPAFAEGLLGDGAAVEPSNGRFVSPCDGTVVGISETLHAYNLLSEDGLELLLHVGIDTVELRGEGFSPRVKAGDQVRAGDLLAVVDLALIRERGYSTLTPLIVTNPERVASLTKAQGCVRGGADPILQYILQK